MVGNTSLACAEALKFFACGFVRSLIQRDVPVIELLKYQCYAVAAVL